MSRLRIILNKEFIKALRGGHCFMKLFHKIPLFLGTASLNPQCNEPNPKKENMPGISTAGVGNMCMTSAWEAKTELVQAAGRQEIAPSSGSGRFTSLQSILGRPTPNCPRLHHIAAVCLIHQLPQRIRICCDSLTISGGRLNFLRHK